MRFRNRRKATRWARWAMKWGLILTDAKLLEAMADDLRHTAHSVTDRVQRKLDGRPAREQEEQMLALARSGPDWFGRATTLVAGIGIGVGVGLLFAPLSGEDTRAVIRDKAADLKDRVTGAAARTMRFNTAGSATGTDGD